MIIFHKIYKWHYCAFRHCLTNLLAWHKRQTYSYKKLNQHMYILVITFENMIGKIKPDANIL